MTTIPSPPRGLAVAGSVAVLVLLAASALLGPGARAAESASDPELAWLAEKAIFFEAHPELMATPGSGWKPYNRIKWFLEQRLVDGQLPPQSARWEAWQRKRALERDMAVPRASWFSLGPANLSGRVLDLEFDPGDPNIVYVGAAGGGLWKSTDNGSSWVTTTDELPSLSVSGIAVYPLDPSIVVIATGYGTNNSYRFDGVGILKSTDGGVTFQETGFSVGITAGFHALNANPITGTLLAGSRDGLWRSDDAGDTWTEVRTGDDYYDVQWKPGDASRVYTVKGDGSSGNNVKVSTDDGLTWAKAGTGQPPSFTIGKSKVAVSPSSPSTVYAVFGSIDGSGTTGVYRSTDDGGTWTAQNTDSGLLGGQTWFTMSLVVDPDDPNTVMTGGVPLMRSLDGGQTFSQVGGGFVHVDHHIAVYEPGSSSTLWVGTDGGVWKSTNDGSSWIDKNPGLVTYQFYDVCVAQSDPLQLLGGTQDQGTDKWTGTTTWTEGLGGDGMVCNVNPNNANVVYAERQNGNHYKSTNGGTSWSQINGGLTGSGLWVTPVDEDQNLANHLYTSTGDGIFRTTNGGGLWEQVATHSAKWISISPVDGNVVWTVQGGTKLSTDDGGSWQDAAPFGLTTGSTTRVLAHPTDVSSALVTFSGYGEGLSHVVLTTDLGASWTDVTGDFVSQPVNCIAVDPLATDHWFIGTDVGVWATTDGGAHWGPYEAGFPNTIVHDLEIQVSARKLVAGTFGRGAWEVDIVPPLSTDADVRVAAAPPNLMLDPPFPNPARDRAVLRFAAKSGGPVSLDVYDVRGRLVSRVAALDRGDGIIRAASWLPGEVPSGVYFAVLTAGDESRTRKIVVAK
jgi:photosystem II stability/assembly factor-like uncharacterized protein